MPSSFLFFAILDATDLYGICYALAAPDAPVEQIGVQWAATLLAGFQLLLVPVPFLFYK